MNKRRKIVRSVFDLAVMGVVLCCGCWPPAPPVCNPSMIGCPPTPNGPVGNWPTQLTGIQNDEQWAVFDANAAFSALPQPVQDQNRKAFDDALRTVNQADQTFIDAVNTAIAAGNLQFAAAITDIINAMAAFYNVVSSFSAHAITAHSSAGERAQVQVSSTQLADMRNRIEDMKEHR